MNFQRLFDNGILTYFSKSGVRTSRLAIHGVSSLTTDLTLYVCEGDRPFCGQEFMELVIKSFVIKTGLRRKG